MNAFRIILIFALYALLCNKLHSQQYTLEFSVIGTGGGESQIGQDTLFQTVGQSLVGDTPPDSNNATGFFNLVSGGPVGLSFGIYQINDKWNMVSVPFIMSDYHKSVLYPAAISNAFSYQGTYSTQAVLVNGEGYWLKFSGKQSVTLIGAPRAIDSVDISPGWNMIGSLSIPIGARSITSFPAGIMTSRFFSYNGSYQIASTVDPGQAYWVKAAQGGKLYLSSGVAVPGSGPIAIMPGTETPPPAPGESDDERQSHPLPTQFALAQNFPNPFNPSTVIHYDLPRSGHVRLVVYNILGEILATLVDGVQDAGYRSVVWDAGMVPSGIYFYRLQASDFTDMKKMIIMK